ncbi:MAG: hypothetical protein V3R95_09505 [Dehalococcoidia bacterium]
MEQLAQDFAETASFFTVWVREAHAGGDYPQPEDIETRERYARSCVEAHDAKIPVIVDDMDGSLHQHLGHFPNAVYVLDGRGRVAYRSVWSSHREIRRVLESLRESDERFANKVYSGMPLWSEQMLRKLPDDPTQDLRDAFDVWEQAKNYDEPERFYGAERAEGMREQYEQLTGKKTVRPEEVPAGDD